MQKPKPAKSRRFAPGRHDVDHPPQRFFGALTMSNIYGSWWASARDGFFTVRWGRFYAYLHQFDSESQAILVKCCAAGEAYREYPHIPSGQEGACASSR
jgi:hypothetical protein